MRIENVEAIYLRLPNVDAKSDSSREALLIKISTDTGVVGWGEVDSSPLVTKAIIEAPFSHNLAAGLKHVLIGEDPLDTLRLWNKMYQATLYYGREGAVIHAMAGIDLALWDIKGKVADLPVWKLLGGRYRDRLRVYASSLFRMTPEETAARARELVSDGYTAIKFGWEPFGRDLRSDIQYLESIREAVGFEVDLMIDAGHVWDAKTAMQRCRAFDPFDIYWLEEPLHPDNVQGYKRISDAVAVRIAAGEEESTVTGFHRLIEVGKIDVVQVDLTRCGLTQAMRIAELAQRRGLLCVNHNFTTDINVSASLHFLSAIPNASIMEYCVEPSDIARNLAKVPIKVVDGMANVPDAPGLGIEPNPALIEKYVQ